MAIDLRQPPLHAEVTDWVWKHWFQKVYQRILEIDLTGGVVTNVTASSPLASSGGITPNISLTGTVGIANGGTGATTAATARANLVVPEIGGTPAQYRVATWTDADTIGSDANFLWNGAVFSVASSSPLGMSASYQNMQLGSGVVWQVISSSLHNVNNAYHDGTSWKYATSTYAALTRLTTNEWSFWTGPSGTAGNTVTFSQLFLINTNGQCAVKTNTVSSSIFGSSASYDLNVNGTAFVKGLYSLGANASEVHRDVSGAGAISTAQSALQVGLQSTNNADSISAGGGPSILFFGFDDANPPVKQFIGRVNGVFENGAASSISGGVAVYVRTNNADSTAATLACTWKASKNMVQEGFTQLGGSGAPAIKMKKLTGTTNSAEGGSTSVAHGLTGSKIIGFTCKVEYATDSGMPWQHTTFAGYQYDVYHNGTNFIVYNHATNSENLLSKNFIITVWYEE